MTPLSPAVTTRHRRPMVGWGLCGAVIAFLLLDAGMKIAGAEVAVSTTVTLGYPADQVKGIGVLLLAVTLLYALPRTAVLGAVLLTGYLGGAVATQLRVEGPLFSHVLFGVYVAAIAWAGLCLRAPQVWRMLSGGR